MKVNLASQSGMAAILTVIIISAVSLIIAKSITGLGLADVDMSYHNLKGNAVLSIADSCLEETLRRLQIDNNYTANNLDLELGGGTCSINISADSDSRTITIAGQLGDYYKNIEAEVEIIENCIVVNKWEEVN